MSNSSNNQGRAYEYAWLQALYEALRHKRNTEIIHNSSFFANERAWKAIEPSKRALFISSADAAVNTILELEPKVSEKDPDRLTLQFQQDGAGIKGDVRDIVLQRGAINWEFGLSIKHNHEAVKHSRLSHKLDFGNEWFGAPCSKEYWSDVTPVFNQLKHQQILGTKWSNLADKEAGVYVPLLQAFINEIKRAYQADPSIPLKMVEYLIGVKDYYKVVSRDDKRLTMIHTFNMHRTLNKPSRVKISAFSVPIVKLPTELIAIKFKRNSNTTVELYLDNGWQLSFRIHNASTLVEPSLKFDIQFVGMPGDIMNIECHWH